MTGKNISYRTTHPKFTSPRINFNPGVGPLRLNALPANFNAPPRPGLNRLSRSLSSSRLLAIAGVAGVVGGAIVNYALRPGVAEPPVYPIPGSITSNGWTVRRVEDYATKVTASVYYVPTSFSEGFGQGNTTYASPILGFQQQLSQAAADAWVAARAYTGPVLNTSKTIIGGLTTGETRIIASGAFSSPYSHYGAQSYHLTRYVTGPTTFPQEFEWIIQEPLFFPNYPTAPAPRPKLWPYNVPEYVPTPTQRPVRRPRLAYRPTRAIGVDYFRYAPPKASSNPRTRPPKGVKERKISGKGATVLAGVNKYLGESLEWLEVISDGFGYKRGWDRMQTTPGTKTVGWTRNNETRDRLFYMMKGDLNLDWNDILISLAKKLAYDKAGGAVFKRVTDSLDKLGIDVNYKFTGLNMPRTFTSF
jgi:hypothetical protein